MRTRTGRFGTSRVRRSLLATAVLSSVLVPATLIATAQSALAATSSSSGVVEDWYCDHYSANPIKVNDDGGSGYEVETLTVASLSVSTIANDSGDGIDSGISEINALGISPIDKKAYGIVSGAQLVRFDDNDIHYVADVEESATQGTFDVHGDYIYGDGSEIYRVRRPDLLTGYTSSGDSGISDQSSATSLVSASSGQVADWAAIRADLGSGAANYLVGLDGNADKVMVVKYQTHGGASDTATGSTIASLTPSTAFANNNAWRNAWYWEGRLIFQMKNGDVYEVGTNLASDLTGTADVTDHGKESKIKDGDGMNCFDIPGFTVAELGGSTSVNESGTTDTFTVVLDSKPAGNVVITASSSDSGEATVGAPLTFTTGNWDSAQTVTVTGVNDDDDDGDIDSTITLTITDGSTNDVAYDGVANQTVTATTVDDDPQAGFTKSTSSVTVTEASGGSHTATFTVVLDSEPTGNVVIDVTSGTTGQATVSPSSLTFTTGNWDSTQTVTVTGVDNDVDGSNAGSTITLSVNDGSTADANYDALADQTVAAALTDDDTAGFTKSTSSVTVTEASGGSHTATFTVVLDSEPTGNVVIDVTSGTTGQATVSPSSLTFTTGNWDSAQTVTVTGVDNDVDGSNAGSTVTLAVNDGSTADANYDALSDQTVAAALTDDDTAGFTKSTSSVTVTEAAGGSNTATFTVVLDSEPSSGTVVIDVTSGTTGQATVSPSSLTFTTGNWDSAQTVTVTGVDNDVDGSNAGSTVTLAVNDGSTADANYDALSDQTVTAALTDDDEPSGGGGGGGGGGPPPPPPVNMIVTQSNGSTYVSEDETTDTFTVALDTEPTANVLVLVSGGDITELTLAPVALTFTSTDWNIPQTVTVTGVDDVLFDGIRVTYITISVFDSVSADEYRTAPSISILADTYDNEVASYTVAESGGSTVVSEDETTDTFTVVLDTEPTADVVVSISHGDPSEITLVLATLTFTPGNWSIPQTVTVTGVDDVLLDGDRVTYVTVAVVDSASADEYGTAPSVTILARTTDNEVAGYTVAESGGSTVVSEDGDTDSFTVVLDERPGSNVVFSVASQDQEEGLVSPFTLTFTSSNWDMSQTVVVTGVNDGLDDGDQDFLVVVSVVDNQSDSAFTALSDTPVSAVNLDNDDEPEEEPEEEVEDVLPACVVGFGSLVESEGSTVMSESGSSDSFTFGLGSEPVGDVVVSVVSSDLSEAVVSASTLTFTASNWDTSQTVVVTGVNDGLSDGDQAVDVTLSAAGFEPVVVGVVNADND